MALIRIGKKGINLAHVVRWASREEDDGNGQKYPVVGLEYVNGESDTFARDEAVALRSELEHQSSGIMSSLSAAIYS